MILLQLLLYLTALLLLDTTTAKEIIASYEWQKVGPTDTLPAGLEIRMDLGSEGGTWARLPPKEINDGNSDHQNVVHKKRCGPSCKERQKERAEKRRAAGFFLREPTHHHQQQQQDRREQEIVVPSNHDTSISWQQAVIFFVGLSVGVGVTTQLRGRQNGLHEH